MRLEHDGIRFQPCVPKAFRTIHLSGLQYRHLNLDVMIEGHGTEIQAVRINDEPAKAPYVPLTQTEPQTIEITLGR
jgi:hypothetical protein